MNKHERAHIARIAALVQGVPFGRMSDGARTASLEGIVKAHDDLHEVLPLCNQALTVLTYPELSAEERLAKSIEIIEDAEAYLRRRSGQDWR